MSKNADFKVNVYSLDIQLLIRKTCVSDIPENFLVYSTCHSQVVCCLIGIKYHNLNNPLQCLVIYSQDFSATESSDGILV